jgi:hypothetical protein
LALKESVLGSKPSFKGSLSASADPTSLATLLSKSELLLTSYLLGFLLTCPSGSPPSAIMDSKLDWVFNVSLYSSYAL